MPGAMNSDQRHYSRHNQQLMVMELTSPLPFLFEMLSNSLITIKGLLFNYLAILVNYSDFYAIFLAMNFNSNPVALRQYAGV